MYWNETKKGGKICEMKGMINRSHQSTIESMQISEPEEPRQPDDVRP